jgi:translation initiation factor 2B subunit (eIF-2B alpha/beta/delta family)
VLAAKKIKPGNHVLVHSLNNHIVDTLDRATRYKNFSLNVVEHKPFEFGKILSEKLSEKLKVNLVADISFHKAVEHSDIVLLGGEALFEKGAIVKTGAHPVAKYAHEHRIPVYVCLNSYKHNRKAAKLLSHEHSIGDYAHRNAYELIENNLIRGFVTEHGIYNPEHATTHLKKLRELSK